MSDHVVPLKVYHRVFGALLILLIITVVAAFVHLGSVGNIMLAMTIAVAKMTLIILYFMHVRYSSKLTMVFAASGFLWMAIMLSFFVSDVAARPDVRPPWTHNTASAPEPADAAHGAEAPAHH